MFTGLIESVGRIADAHAVTARLAVSTTLGHDVSPGDSVAVNGVCLTVVRASADGLEADVSPETARVTTLGNLGPGALVNLERPMRADARLGGHFVQGHVDGTGVLEVLRKEGESYWLTVRFPQELARYIVLKGSIAVDGISLTVASLDGDRFGVQIVPFTWLHTNLQAARPGDAVNIECDILGKYVARALALR
jgi:riboflavin synthase